MFKTNKTVRKLYKTGDYSYMITLPKEWVKKLKLKAKHNVSLEIRSGTIIIKRLRRKKIIFGWSKKYLNTTLVLAFK